MFEAFGKITSYKVMYDETGKSRCFGFVAFEEAEAAEEAVNQLNGKEMDGKTVYVGRAQKKNGNSNFNLILISLAIISRFKIINI